MLTGLNYFKGKTDPVALADSEYPEWLWSCMDVMKKSGGTAESGAGDEFCTLLPAWPANPPTTFLARPDE